MRWDKRMEEADARRVRDEDQKAADRYNRAKDVVDARKCKCNELAKPGTSTCGGC